MAKMTLDELKKLRDEKKRAIDMRESSGKDIEIVVGMATCGIAAGAKQVLDTLLTELETKHMTNVLVRQTGCMGLCHSEPTVEVVVPGMPPVIYGNVDIAIVKEIISKHLIGRELLSGHILDRPAIDILKP